MLEEFVCTPMFLPNVRDSMIHCATVDLACKAEVETGDLIEVKYVGTTKDSDGWPMNRWAVRLYKGR
jgi:hypothetical protein